MISIDLIQKTAETLMDKAAIEIPDDYLTGLKAAAHVEDGDLSSFVLQAMLENYEAAKEDRRAMCGDTGTPHRLGSGIAARDGKSHEWGAFAPKPCAPVVADGS
jgi:tartrate dehydratase alpha subunit/fumarate hydratase class I-like protein